MTRARRANYDGLACKSVLQRSRREKGLDLPEVRNR